MREIFKLVGTITTEGFEGLTKKLDAIDKQAAKVSKSLNRFGRDVSSIGMTMTKFVSGPIIAAAGALTVAAAKTGEFADKIQDLNQITGLSTDSLQELKYVAEVSGGSFEGLVGIITKFSGHLPEIRKGTGEASKALRTLGVNVFDSNGHVRNMNDLFPELVKKLQLVQNVTERNAMAQKIFGKDLSEIAPILGMTGQQFDAMRQKAHNLGLVMSGDALNAADDYRAQVADLKAQFAGFIRSLASDFIPVLTGSVIPMLRDQVVPIFKSFGEKVKAVIDWFKNLDPQVRENIIRFAALLAVMGPTLVIIGKMISGVRDLYKAFVVLRGVAAMFTVELLANPWTAAAVAIGAVAIALYKTKKAYDEYDKNTKRAENVSREMQELARFHNELKATIITYENLKAKKSPLFDADKLADAKAMLESVTETMKKTNAEIQGKPLEAPTVPTIGGGGSPPSVAGILGPMDKQAAAAMKAYEIEKDASDKINELHNSDLQKLDAKYKEEIDLAQQVGADTTDITQRYLEERQNMVRDEADNKISEAARAAKARDDIEAQQNENEKKRSEESKQRALDTANAWIGAFGQVGSQISGIFAQLSANKAQATENWYNREKKAIDNSKLNESEKAKKMAALDSEAEQRRRRIAIDEAKREKTAGIFSALINTAESITKALTYGIPGIALAVVMGILGAAQVAAIAAQPLPELAGGGLVNDNSPNGRIVRVAEKGPEWVIPMKMVRKGLAEDIVGAAREYGGQSVNDILAGGSNISNGGAQTVDSHDIHLHAGVIVADQYSLKELERKLYPHRVAESQRRGAD